MDPTACLDRIAAATTQDELDEALNDLHAWLVKGGFPPEADTPARVAAWKTFSRWVAG